MTAIENHMPILPPATIGILGGGQLGMFFVIAAHELGYHTIVLEPDPDCPASTYADAHIVADYDNPEALERMAVDCDVVTTEFENPPAHALTFLAERTIVRPSADAIGIAQDRRNEKQFLLENGFPTAPFAVVSDGVLPNDAAVGFPAILKTARMGYDGKGQIRINTSEELPQAWEQMVGVPCVLEQLMPLETEISVVLARTHSGEIATYAPSENFHVNGILDHSVVPFAGDLTHQAQELAVRLAHTLKYVGVLAVEMFVVNQTLLINEMAPRPHNSGHWTLDAAVTSQFEQQVRAVCGIELGDTSMTHPAAVMVNLLGERWENVEPDWAAMTPYPDAHLHLYGKRLPRAGRKMGHLTVTARNIDTALSEALRLTATHEENT